MTQIYSKSITTEIALDLAELWESVVGDYFGECAYWQDYVETIQYRTEGHSWKASEWQETNHIVFTYDATDLGIDGETGTQVKKVYAQDFAEARIRLYQDGQTHCGDCPIEVLGDPSEWDDDACVVDLIVQTAVFGKIIFG